MNCQRSRIAPKIKLAETFSSPNSPTSTSSSSPWAWGRRTRVRSSPKPRHRPSPPLLRSPWTLVPDSWLAGRWRSILILIGAQRRSQSVPHTEPTMQREVPVLASVSGAEFGGSGVNEADLRRMCREIAALDAAPGPVALIGGGDPATATGVALQLGAAWASEFGASVVVSTDSTARDALPKGVRDLPGVFDLLANGVSPADCAARVPDSRALLIGPGNRANVATEVSGQRLTQLWAQLDREFGTVLVSSLQQESPIASMTIRTAGQVVGIVRADRGRDQDVGALLNTLDNLSAADRLVGVVLVEDGDIQMPRPGSSPVADPRPVPESVDVAPSNSNPFDPDQGSSEARDRDEVTGSVYDQLTSRFGSAT